MKDTARLQLLKSAESIDKFCDFLHQYFYKETILHSKQLANLMREAAKGEYPPFYPGIIIKGIIYLTPLEK